MRSILFLSLSALATLAAAASKANPFNIPNNGYQFSAGESTALTWTPTTKGTVTLMLQWGSVFTSGSGSTIVSSIPNSGSYTWSVPSDIAARPDYTVEIISDDDPTQSNYLNRFTIAGATGIATSSTATATATATKTKTASTTATDSTTTGTATESTTTGTATTMTTQTSSSSSTSTSSSSSSTSDSTKTTASSTSTSPPTSVPNSNGGVINRISGGMMALILGVIAVV
ncbi:GPI anchored serine-threonine rich family protein [Aspergillus clavatus NRRL 1]|uniref:GPI anchored protein, putative n=1 Tax=Aspergillus clavatus (strain ATCC 1007 / CBS 513.65 / DSM 816 / NCTC 3887 / NRRL 1 / QM 1276 / 107) TaxID=344612 RepID=A1C3X6_ASPCL|nr:GPI anchored protein, putative [Aspergillus clavatus NRRL 1]EAW15116.1 GPI anchored protein, putative [Aspergillus clavatus NRRL 1]